MNPSAWITVRTAARILGISHNTVRKEIERGDLPVLGKVDNRIVVLDRAYIEREAKRRTDKAKQSSQAA